MKPLDVSKCHEDSPDFRASLEKMEASFVRMPSYACVAKPRDIITCNYMLPY